MTVDENPKEYMKMEEPKTQRNLESMDPSGRWARASDRLGVVLYSLLLSAITSF